MIGKAKVRSFWVCSLSYLLAAFLLQGCDQSHSMPEKEATPEMSSETQLDTQNNNTLKNEESLQLADRLRGLGAKNVVVDEKGLSYVDLSDSNATDDTIRLLENSKTIVYLNLSGTQVTDKSLAILKHLPEIKWLFLNNTDIGNDALDHLRGLNQLKILALAALK